MPYLYFYFFVLQCKQERGADTAMFDFRLCCELRYLRCKICAYTNFNKKRNDSNA